MYDPVKYYILIGKLTFCGFIAREMLLLGLILLIYMIALSAIKQANK